MAVSRRAHVTASLVGGHGSIVAVPNHQANSPSDVVGRLRRLATDRRALRRERGAVADTDGRPGTSAGRPSPLPRSTVDSTIRPVESGRYLRLGWAPGEPHVVLADDGVTPAPDRATKRRSLLYFAQHTDAHVCDVQAPARLEGGESFGWFNPGADGGHRPQEAFTAQVLDRMVAATNAVVDSPETGARMAWCIQTGDNTDNRTRAELAWWMAVLEGEAVTPNTGAPDRYEGIQRSGRRGYWQPDDPRRDIYGRAGFPHLPGVLDAGIASFEPAGLDVPWLAVFGNHDAIFSGSFGPTRGVRLDLLGPMLAGAAAKPAGTVGLVRAIVHASVLGSDTGRWERWAERCPIGIQQVVPDPEARAPVSMGEFVSALIEADTRRGPVGHGFTERNLADGTSWWSRAEGEHVQVLGLDTYNHSTGDGGAIGPRQWRWLEEELALHHRSHDGTDRLVVVMSHHNSWTMDNHHDDEADPGRQRTGPELLDLLKAFPNVVLWVNGHCHEHRVIRHRHDGPGTGLWEVDTASLIDFSQQARTFELLDNGDGTVSILTTVLDHASPPEAARHRDGRWEVVELASLSRELAVNDDRWIDPLALLGRREDRNVEMVLRAPFPLRR